MAGHCSMWAKSVYWAPNKFSKLMQLCPSIKTLYGCHKLEFRLASHSSVRSMSQGPSSYTEVFRRSMETPEEFWAEAAENLHWFKKWDRVVDRSREPLNQW